LAARAAVAAGIRGLPGPCRIKGAAAMTGHIGHRAENRNRGAAAIIRRGRRIKGPGHPLFHCLIGAAARNDRRGRIDHRHLLTARAAVAAGIGGLPGPRCIEGAAAMASHIG